MNLNNIRKQKRFLVPKKLAISVCLFSFLFCVGAQASAQQPTVPDSLKENTQPLNLEQTIQVALANNTQIRQSLLSIKDAQQQIRTAWSNVLPEVSANASYTRNLEVPVNFLPEVVFNPKGDPDNLIPVAFGTDNNWNGGISVSQTIFNGQAFVGISSSELYKAAQSENLRATAQQVITQARQAYYALLLSRERLHLQEAQMERIKKNLKDTKKLLEQGFVDEYAVLQLKVKLSNLKPRLKDARYGIDKARRNLLDVVGLPLKYPLKISGDLNSFAVKSKSAQKEINQSIKQIDRATPLQFQSDSLLLRQASSYRGDLRMLNIQQKLQNKKIKAQKSQYLPTLSASYNLQYRASQAGQPVFFGNKDSRARSQTVMLNLRLPLFQGFKRDAAIERSKIELRSLKLSEYQTEKKAHKQILAAEENIQKVYETATARKQAREQAREGYERARLRYNNGLGSQQEVTDAQVQLRQAELNYAQMVFNYLKAKANYDQAVGQVPLVDDKPETLRRDIKN